jgi:preprotein translocase subunit SecY
MYSGFQNLPRIPELRRRLGFTLMILAVYRLAVAVPTPASTARRSGSISARRPRPCSEW